MKVLLLTNSFENIVNGPAKFANLILEINEKYPSYQIRILTEDVSPERLSSLAYVYKAELNYPRFAKPLGQILRMFIYYKQAKRIRKDYPYDLLLYINAFNGLWASWVSPIPTAGMINDDNNLTATWGNFKLDRMWVKKMFFKQLEKLSARSHRFIISNSDYLSRQLAEAYRLPASRLFRLYKAIDLSKISYTPSRAFQSPVKILFVKADFQRGGLKDVAEALSRLPDYSFLITIIGPHERFQKHIMSLFADFTHVTVDFRGEQPQSVVQACMGTYDLFCVPSYREALGVANIEALSIGIPVITSWAGGIPEVMDQGNNGWLVQPGQPAGLTQAIRECITNESLRLQKSESGRKFVERFSKAVMLEELIDILNHGYHRTL
jgi:glycosyltransferase involved in cell wall biosynthesis